MVEDIRIKIIHAHTAEDAETMTNAWLALGLAKTIISITLNCCAGEANEIGGNTYGKTDDTVLIVYEIK